MSVPNPVPATNGDVYIAPEERTGEKSVVFFTRDLSPEGLKKAWRRVADAIKGEKVAIKLHTGEPNGPNIIPPSWIKSFMETEAPNATIIETNTWYHGNRFETEDHRKTLEVNGWTEFTNVDIVDAHDRHVLLPVKGGKWFDTMSVGAGMAQYDSLIVLTHFKGHGMGGFGGSNKNLGIGCASGHEGKKWIHANEDGAFGINGEELHERFTECTKATVDFFEDSIAFVNVMRNMSVSCDCEGVDAAPVTTPNVGILASLDICAIDTACVDLVWAMKDEDNKDLKERIQSRHGLRQLTYMNEIGLGSMNYTLIDIDNDDAEITPADCVVDLKPFQA